VRFEVREARLLQCIATAPPRRSSDLLIHRRGHDHLLGGLNLLRRQAGEELSW
jgi:hypothetical protein